MIRRDGTSASPAALRGGGRGLLVRTLRCRRGATAIEFGLVALPFFIVVIGIFEVAFTIVAGLALEKGVEDAARALRTGQIQAAEDPAAEIRNRLCHPLMLFVDCNAVALDVRTQPNFAGTTLPDSADDYDFDPGGAGQIMTLRVRYVWYPLTPLYALTGGSMSEGRPLMYTAIVKGEPWD